jgi:glycerophosphoryl diester phosphodiesterase
MILTVLLLLPQAIEAKNKASIELMWHAKKPHVMVMAHRGDHRKAPENTILAYEKAIEAGAHFVEVDARLTIDNHWVVYHDRVINTSSGRRKVLSSLTLYEVRKQRISGKRYGLPDQRIPTLHEVLEALKGRVLIYIDDKMGRPLELANIIREHEMEDQVVVRIADYADAILMSEFASEVAWLAHVKPIKNDIDKYLALKPTIVEVSNVYALTKDKRDQIHKAGAKIMTNCMGHRDSREYYSIYVEKFGADIVQTDNLERLLAYADKQAIPST